MNQIIQVFNTVYTVTTKFKINPDNLGRSAAGRISEGFITGKRNQHVTMVKESDKDHDYVFSY